MALAVPTSQVVGCERCFNLAGLLTKGLKVRDTSGEPKNFSSNCLCLLVNGRFESCANWRDNMGFQFCEPTGNRVRPNGWAKSSSASALFSESLRPPPLWLTARVPLRFCNWCSRLSSAARVKSLAIPFEGLSEILLTFSSHPQLVNGGSQSQVARICRALGHRRRVGHPISPSCGVGAK